MLAAEKLPLSLKHYGALEVLQGVPSAAAVGL